MGPTTGIEIGPDFCVLVGARRGDASAELAAVRVISPDEWPTDASARAAMLRIVRAQFRFRRECVVVCWDSSDREILRPLEDAGFRIRRTVAPTDALAALARVTPRPVGGGATAWLAINTNAAAIIVEQNGTPAYAQVINWKIAAPDARVNANLLRRYLRVAQIVPELRRAMASARPRVGTIDSAITCGNLPDLRSLTMPLIGEVDIEVETLDSTVGLDFADRRAEHEDLAPLVRLAAAVALEECAKASNGVPAAAKAAAALLLVAGLGWLAFAQWSTASKAIPVVAPDGVVSMRPQPGEIPQVARSREEPESAPPAAAPAAPKPPATVPRPQPQATSGRVGGAPEADESPRPEPRREPRLPRLDGVLISDRVRLAVIDGAIVAVGDTIGSRKVARIENDAVILSDAAGRETRLEIGAKAGR